MTKQRILSRFAKRLSRKRILIALLTLLPLIVVFDYQLYPNFAKVGGTVPAKTENGLWLRYTWYFGMNKEPRIKQLADKLKDNHIRYAYFHVRSIQKDGSLKHRYGKSADRLNSTLHEYAPSVKSVAWVYIGNNNGMGQVDLGNAATRRKIIGEAKWLVSNCGFDGVQIDYERCWNDDKSFLTLMHELKAGFPKDKTLSVAAPLWLPSPFLRWGGWSGDYFTKIASTCDQICVMDYDSSAYFPRAYVWLTRKQVTEVCTAVETGNPTCKVLIGIPTYGGGTQSHNPRAENVRLALKGVREGLAHGDASRRNFDGVAIFADYTTQADEWKVYRELWGK